MRRIFIIPPPRVRGIEDELKNQGYKTEQSEVNPDKIYIKNGKDRIGVLERDIRAIRIYESDSNKAKRLSNILSDMDL